MINNYIVYRHTCPNGKVYIGITGELPSKRWNGGNGYIQNKHFYRAIEKYGWQNIRHEILLDSLTKDEACQKEIELIAEYKSNNPKYGYNISCGGESGNAGVIASEETRQKMSVAHTGANNAFFGKKHSEETKKKLSIANTGKPSPFKGKKTTEETRKKQSECKRGEKNPMYGKRFTQSQEAHDNFMAYVETRDYSSGKNPKARKVCQYSINGELVKVWDCIKEASEYIGVTYSCLIKYMKIGKPYKGFIWNYQKKGGGVIYGNE